MNLSQTKNLFYKSGIEIALSIANPLFGTVRIFIFTRIFESGILANISIALSSLALLSSLSLGGIPQLHFLYSVKSKENLLDIASLYTIMITSSIGVMILWVSTGGDIVSFWFVIALLFNEIFIVVNSGILGKDEVRKNKLYDLSRNSLFVLIVLILVVSGYYVGKDEVLMLYALVILAMLSREFLFRSFKLKSVFKTKEVLQDGLKLLPVFASVWIFGYILRLLAFKNLGSDAYNALSIGLTYYDNIYILITSVASIYLPKYYSGKIQFNPTLLQINLLSISLIIVSVMVYFIVVPILTDGKYLLDIHENILYAFSMIVKLFCYGKFQKLMKGEKFTPILFFFITSLIFEVLVISIIDINNILEYILIYTLTYFIYSISLHLYERKNTFY